MTALPTPADDESADETPAPVIPIGKDFGEAPPSSNGRTASGKSTSRPNPGSRHRPTAAYQRYMDAVALLDAE